MHAGFLCHFAALCSLLFNSAVHSLPLASLRDTSSSQCSEQRCFCDKKGKGFLLVLGSGFLSQGPSLFRCFESLSPSSDLLQWNPPWVAFAGLHYSCHCVPTPTISLHCYPASLATLPRCSVQGLWNRDTHCVWWCGGGGWPGHERRGHYQGWCGASGVPSTFLPVSLQYCALLQHNAVQCTYSLSQLLLVAALRCGCSFSFCHSTSLWFFCSSRVAAD